MDLEFGKRKVIALSDQKGQLKIINNRGDAYKLSFKELENANAKLAFANVMGDPAKDFVTLDKNKVACYYQDKRQLKQHFEIALKEEQDEVFAVEALQSPYSYFGTLCQAKKEINLFNAQNALHPDFPLAGTTPFSMIDLYQNNNYILLVGYENAVYAYRIAKAETPK